MPDPVSLLQAKIPSSGQRLPRLGLGTYRSFDIQAKGAAAAELTAILEDFHRLGGRLIDCSPMYGQAEATLGTLAKESGLTDSLFMATKVWTTGLAEGKRQMEQSLAKLRRPGLELMQVHNLMDWKTHWPVLRDWKQMGQLRYIGITHYNPAAFESLAVILEKGTVDFLQIPYNLAEHSADRYLLSVAEEHGVAVIANEPFDQGSLFKAVRGKALPAWAGDLGIRHWAQYFLKFILGDPRVQFVIPATGKLAHWMEFWPAATGPLPSAEQRALMLRELQAL
jgi:diketogulonate reductase-like aldo/keto reductase